MPLRRAPPRRASARARRADVDPLAPLTSARRVYDILELRQHVWQYVEMRDLASLMRVEKKGMQAVARVLYHTREFPEVVKMNRSTARSRLYCHSVSVINIHSDHLGPAALRKIGVSRAALHQGKSSRKDVVKYLLDVLCRKCRGTRKLFYADHDYAPSAGVRVHLHSVQVLPGRVRAGGIQARGHIVSSYQQVYSSDCHPPVRREVRDDSPPSSDFTIETRTDLILVQTPPEHGGGPVMNDEWSYLYRSIDLDGVEPQLDDLTSLHKKQSALGYKQRLEEIWATQTCPFDLGDFTTFAFVASTSLVYLQLAATYAPRPTTSGLTFADIPSLTILIRHSLLNLRDLALSMSGLATAEAACGHALSSTTLLEHGTLNRLQIIAAREEWVATPLWNVIRCLSAACSREVVLMVDVGINGKDDWSTIAQTMYLRQLKAQSMERREHLSTLDFATLGIHTPSLVALLEYSEDGRPIRINTSAAKSLRTAAYDFMLSEITRHHLENALAEDRLWYWVEGAMLLLSDERDDVKPEVMLRHLKRQAEDSSWAMHTRDNGVLVRAIRRVPLFRLVEFDLERRIEQLQSIVGDREDAS